ncbi:MAG TPA: hypothetical protein VMA09_08115 [Candidatus Binataceae bacterium]|nr:hypothetical protein [Candidatus Binataceae bacterium]
MALIACTLDARGAEDADQARQTAEYEAEQPKTIIQLQQFRRSETIGAEGSSGLHGTATLINLNPQISSWYLLTLDWGTSEGQLTYHLENPRPHDQTIHLSAGDPHGIQISSGDHITNCDLWSEGALEEARQSSLPYAPLCDGNLYLRNRASGHFTALEWTSDFLRNHVWGGEEIVGLVRKEFFSDHFAESGTQAASSSQAATGAEEPGWPLRASLNQDKSKLDLAPENLGIDVGKPLNTLEPGQWYPANGIPGVYVSFIEPQMISVDILNSYHGVVNRLDSVESAALDYLVAFDLADFDLGFALGTDHPHVGWSPRPPRDVRDDLPGPDGISTAAPLVTNGLISPALAVHTIATFAGGFKREHGAFKYGPFSQINHGTHYGFIEQGVVFSKLQQGLATLYVLDDGTVQMKSWTDADNALLARIKFARQNGVPIIERSTTGTSVPGALIARWGPGNWSGSAEEDLRSLRAGACLEESPTKRFLIYGYFSTATPSAMARVFQAYGCRYAMHLDMNALELTYLALYLHQGPQLRVEYLVKGMAQSEKQTDNGPLLRFLEYPDNRDFFYLVRRASTR